jgi:outer membrane murein-binding lipoprotein Lpp
MPSKIVIIICVLALCLIAGCVGQDKAKADTNTTPARLTLLSTQQDVHGNTIDVYHDDISNVSSYIYHSAYGTAMTSFPDWQLKDQKYVILQH